MKSFSLAIASQPFTYGPLGLTCLHICSRGRLCCRKIVKRQGQRSPVEALIISDIFVKSYLRTANEKLTKRSTALRAIVAGTGVSTWAASFICSIISCSSR